MGKCALCDTPGVNKSTCPLYVKDPKPENWKKHYKAKNPKSKHKKIVLKQTTIRTPSSIGRTPPVRFSNPYVTKSREVSLVKKKIMESARKNKHIILHGVDLLHFHINIKNAKEFKVKINKSTSIVNKLDEILQLILDIYIAMSQKLVTRKDYFTNPDREIKTLLQMLTETKNKLVEFIVENREGGGGGQTVPSFTVPLDVVISDLDFLKVSEMLEALPTIPSEIPQKKTKSKTKRVLMTTGSGRKRKKTRKKVAMTSTVGKRKRN